MTSAALKTIRPVTAWVVVSKNNRPASVKNTYFVFSTKAMALGIAQPGDRVAKVQIKEIT